MTHRGQRRRYMSKLRLRLPKKERICPAKGQKCNICEGDNHFSRVCTNAKAPPKERLPPASEKKNPGHVDLIQVAGVTSNTPLPTVSTDIAPISPPDTRAIIPTILQNGSQASVGGPSTLSALSIGTRQIKRTGIDNLVAANGAPFAVIGSIQLHASFGVKTKMLNIIICLEVFGLLLSWYDGIKLSIFPENYPAPQLLSANSVSSQPA